MQYAAEPVRLHLPTFNLTMPCARSFLSRRPWGRSPVRLESTRHTWRASFVEFMVALSAITFAICG